MHLKLLPAPWAGRVGYTRGVPGVCSPRPRHAGGVLPLLPAKGRRCQELAATEALLSPPFVPGSPGGAEGPAAGPCPGGAAELQLPGLRGAVTSCAAAPRSHAPPAPLFWAALAARPAAAERPERAAPLRIAPLRIAPLRSAPRPPSRPDPTWPDRARARRLPRSAAGQGALPAVSAGRRGALPAGRARAEGCGAPGKPLGKARRPLRDSRGAGPGRGLGRHR